MTTPWYPASWLDADGNPLPDVFEVTPGEWPPCKPNDEIDVLTSWERRGKRHFDGSGLAGGCEWSCMDRCDEPLAQNPRILLPSTRE